MRSAIASAESWIHRAGHLLRNFFRRESRSSQKCEGSEKGYICWIDEPGDWRRVPRRFRIAGWCFPKEGERIEALRVRLDRREFVVSHGLPRRDVATAYADRPAAGSSGFDVAIDVPPGSVHHLFFDARRAGGAWEEIFRKKIRVRPTHGSGGGYVDWIRQYDTPSGADRARMRNQARSFERRPTFLVLLPVLTSERKELRASIESVRRQVYPFWQLVVLANESLGDEVRHFERRDQRIAAQIRPAGQEIEKSLNAALACGEAEFVLLLSPGDQLAVAALHLLARTVNRHPDTRLLFGDEDRLDGNGWRTDPHFKPAWNWPLLLAQNFVGQVVVFQRDLARSLGCRPGFGMARDYDFLLRCAENVESEQIQHLPYILCHRRNVPSNPAEELQAVHDHLERQRVGGKVIAVDEAKRIRRVVHELPERPPQVSIIIPTRDRAELLKPCVESVLGETCYPNFEVLLVDNGSREPAALQYLASLADDRRVRILRLDEEFNYSRLTNEGVRQSAAEFVLLLNNDVSVIAPDWLGAMVGHGLQPGVGAVGARLLYPDNRVQQAGVILGAGVHGVAEVAHRGIGRSAPGYLARAISAQEVSAVGAACMLVRRDLYLAAGGFDEENLKVAFNDIDFCLKLRALGARIVYAPAAELYHHEHASRGTEYTAANEQRFIREIEFMKSKWGAALQADPFYNPNLSLDSELFTLAFPPRTSRPWA